MSIIKIYSLIIISYTLFSILLFHLLPIKIFFYKGLFIYLLATLTFIAIYTLTKLKKIITSESFIAALSLAFSLNFAFFIIFPVTFERSVTMFFLNKLEEAQYKNQTNCHGLTYEQAEDVLVEEYIKNNRAVKKRVEEQSVAGNIKKYNQCIQITKRGTLFLKFSSLIKKIYNISK